MSQPWPPPPDLASIQQLVRESDPEGHLAEGAPADEYEPEEQALFAAIGGHSTAELRAESLQPVIEQVWRTSFGLQEQELAQRRPALARLAQQIEHFFGPDAAPQVRGSRSPHEVALDL